MENLKDLTLCRDIKCWTRDHPTPTFRDVRLEDTAPRRSAAARCTEVEEDILCHGITVQKEQQKVLTDLTSGQKILAEEL